MVEMRLQHNAKHGAAGPNRKKNAGLRPAAAEGSHFLFSKPYWASGLHPSAIGGPAHLSTARIPYSEKDNLSLSLLLSDKYLITE